MAKCCQWDGKVLPIGWQNKQFYPLCFSSYSITLSRIISTYPTIILSLLQEIRYLCLSQRFVMFRLLLILISFIYPFMLSAQSLMHVRYYSAKDGLSQNTVTDFLQELKAEGKTIIVSTHIFSLIEKICDRVGIIIDGKMVLCDTLSHVTAEMTLEDKFFEIYQETAGEIA